AMFAQQYQTVNSPIHRAVWDAKIPLSLFQPPPLAASAPCDAAMEKSIEVVKKRRDNGTILNDKGKVCNELLEELGSVGYWGMLIEPKYGGQGAPFARFAKFL